MSDDLKKLKKPLPGDSCLLCGGKPSVIGFFLPENSQEYGAAKGKTRLIRYCLCWRGQDKQGTPETVEKVIRHELLGIAI